MLSTICLTLMHVPTYTGCTRNCCQLPREHTTSQVIYLKGSGGLEIHLESNTHPINILGNEILDIDAVFRDRVDQSTYDLYIGCGGCIEGTDPIVVSPVQLRGYEDGELEPFTQTRYFSVFSKKERTFNSSLLHETACPQKHFTIRLVDYMNRTDNRPIVWGPVVGLEEKFTFTELIGFPLYILRNHGSYWNDLGYTYFVCLLCTTSLWLLTKYYITKSICTSMDIREVLYDLATIGFVAAAIEEFVHLVYAQNGIPIRTGFYLGLFLVIFFSQGVPLFFVITVRRDLYRNTSYGSKPWWAPFEVATGFGFFFLLGAGFFLGPACIMMAGLVRGLVRIRGWKQRTEASTLDSKDVHLQRMSAQPQKKKIDKSLGFIS